MIQTTLADIKSKFITKPVGATLYFVFTSVGIFYLFRNWAYDDPFITYRYAHNIVRGLGFVYNPGERVMSTTTPLFTLVLAAVSPLWSDLPRLANLIGAMSLALGALLLYWMADILKEPVVGWAGLLLYPTSPLLLHSLGSETPLYVAFCLACFVFYWRSSYILTAIFCALAILTRPDGLLVPLVSRGRFSYPDSPSNPMETSLFILCVSFSMVYLFLAFLWVACPCHISCQTTPGSDGDQSEIRTRFLHPGQGLLPIMVLWNSGSCRCPGDHLHNSEIPPVAFIHRLAHYLFHHFHNPGCDPLFLVLCASHTRFCDPGWNRSEADCSTHSPNAGKNAQISSSGK